jgi:cytoskeleton protein RodZ
MASAGKLLQQERLKRDRSLSALAKETCISGRYLQAIEDDNLKVLPGDFFYRSFIKQYAQALDLDPKTTESVLAAAEPIQEADPLPALTMAYETAKEEGRSAGLYRPKTRVALALLALVLIGCSGLYSIWYRAQVEEEFTSESAAVPSAPALTRLPAAAKAQEIAEPPTLATPQQVTPAAPSASTAAEPDKIQVDLAATEKTWVSLSSHGKTVFSGVLGAEQTKNFAVSEQAKLMTGNAAGLDIRWNGKPIGPIGARGQVRTVLLNAHNYEILPPRGL